MKIIMLIEHAKKKENWSSKKYEMSNWSFGNATLVPINETLYTASATNIVF